MSEFSVEERHPEQISRLVKTVVTPRPIAWISSVDADGAENLAPFSSYNYVCLHPPVVVFNSPSEASGRMKDTARNALDTEEFAVNVVTAEHLETMDLTSKALPPGESEFELADVERAECRTIAAPRVADAAATLECTLYDAIEVYEKVMILGEVRYVHLDDDATMDGKVDSRKLDTVGRLGGPYYTVSHPTEFERQF